MYEDLNTAGEKDYFAPSGLEMKQEGIDVFYVARLHTERQWPRQMKNKRIVTCSGIGGWMA